MTTPINRSNFSYYIFHPNSIDLSQKDQKKAKLATALLACTLGVGHAICGIVHIIRRSCSKGSKTQRVAETLFTGPEQNKINRETFSKRRDRASIVDNPFSPLLNEVSDIPDGENGPFSMGMTKKILEHIINKSPSNSFELFLFHSFTCFYSNNLENNTHVYKHLNDAWHPLIERNLKKNEIANPTYSDKIFWSLLSCEVTDNSLCGGNIKRDLYPLNGPQLNMLISSYLEEREDVVFLDFGARKYLLDKDPKNKISVCCNLYHLESEEALREFIKTTLENELSAHLNNRPRVIFIPLTLSMKGKTSHEVLLVIEPSSSNVRMAKISMINNHGDHLKWNRADELIAMEAANTVYNDANTQIIRNTKRLFASASCTHNVVDFIRHLADVPSVYDAVKKGLQPMTVEGDKQARLEHKKRIRDVFACYKEYFEKNQEILHMHSKAPDDKLYDLHSFQ